ncbi:RluA family pseudouridine synthase [Lapidilactobacillus bayanensis]|uniref:RluA family pseudouridine synthase n=1 Tax=Lapidilactobacillus bayanensis TaxID=2485998 RepID=UPI000F77B0C5|nr:RluA family pseudouridine synthase [Lapidilactobacillus bayanensis]
MEIKWQVENDSENNIKRFLAAKGVSHRLYSELKRRGRILVDDQIVPFDFPLVSGSMLTVIFPPEGSDANVAGSDGEIVIVAETSHYLLLNKPAGLNTVPGPTNSTDTLVNRVKGHWRAVKSPDRKPHIITRLDRFSSGLVLVAHDILTNNLFVQEQAQQRLEKIYLAVVAGELPDDHGVIDAPLAQAEDSFQQVVTANGKDARTEYWVIKRLPNATVVRVKLHTGRTHQIRAHFASIAHPLLGDELYQGPMDQGIERQALHAWQLTFVEPYTGEEQSFTAPIPEDIATLIGTLD